MRKLKLGILGTGIATRDLYWPSLKLLKSKIEIVAVANRRVAKAQAFAKLAGVKHVCPNADALLARTDVEAVMISLPIPLTAPWVIRCLKAGKHVLSEKPIASHSIEGAQLIREAAKYKKLWMVGENYFFTPHILQAKAWVKQGKLGQIRFVEASQISWLTSSSKYFKTSWRQFPKFQGGFVVDAGVHIAHVIREMFGMPRVSGNVTARFNPVVLPIDTALATMRFSNGSVGSWKSCFSAFSSSEIPMIKIYGSKATLQVFTESSLLEPIKGKPIQAQSKKKGFYYQFEHFADAVTRGEKLRFQANQALQDLQFMEKIITNPSRQG